MGKYCHAASDIYKYFKPYMPSSQHANIRVMISIKYYLNILTSLPTMDFNARVPKKTNRVSGAFNGMIEELVKFEELEPLPPVKLIFLNIVRGIKFKDTVKKIKDNTDGLLAEIGHTTVQVDYDRLVVSIVKMTIVCGKIAARCSVIVKNIIEKIINDAKNIDILKDVYDMHK